MESIEENKEAQTAVVSEDKIELPLYAETLPNNPHISLVIIADAIKQASKNLEELEVRFRSGSDQLQQLQSMRIATTAQKNMLTELYQKIIELDKLK
jgi:hypothetical protein